MKRYEIIICHWDAKASGHYDFNFCQSDSILEIVPKLRALLNDFNNNTGNFETLYPGTISISLVMHDTMGDIVIEEY